MLAAKNGHDEVLKVRSDAASVYVRVLQAAGSSIDCRVGNASYQL
jgi:hypothetical protein